jgi:hydroxyethylthiazole kinase
MNESSDRRGFRAASLETRAALRALRRRKPLVLNVTNLVAMDLTANALLAIGASPLVSQSLEETDELVGLADAVVVNGGTLDERWTALADTALETARALGKPAVLDPVGAGASRYRTATFRDLLRRHRLAAVRANASEILALAGSAATTRGVDATDAVETARDAARELAIASGASVVVSGLVDYVTDGHSERRVTGGSELMTRVTAMGCTASALLAAFLPVALSPLEAGAAAMEAMARAGELAASRATAPGSFRVAFVDALAETIPTEENDR